MSLKVFNGVEWVTTGIAGEQGIQGETGSSGIGETGIQGLTGIPGVGSVSGDTAPSDPFTGMLWYDASETTNPDMILNSLEITGDLSGTTAMVGNILFGTGDPPSPTGIQIGTVYYKYE